MFDFFYQLQRAFTQAELDDPLQETLHLCDILTGGALRGLNGRSLDELDLPALIAQRQAGRPLEYILQRTIFMGREFACTPDALIPRAETELLVKSVLGYARHNFGERPLTIVDVGTGSGNIAVSLALELPQARVIALDISAEAIALAQYHVAKYGLQERVTLHCGDLFEPLAPHGLEKKVDIVVCNPPYIPTGSLNLMADEIVDHEPLVALDAGPYGINIFRRLVKDSLIFLRPEGLLAFEIGAGQAALVQRILHRGGGYDQIEPVVDHYGTPRVFMAQKRVATLEPA